MTTATDRLDEIEARLNSAERRGEAEVPLLPADLRYLLNVARAAGELVEAESGPMPDIGNAGQFIDRPDVTAYFARAKKARVALRAALEGREK